MQNFQKTNVIRLPVVSQKKQPVEAMRHSCTQIADSCSNMESDYGHARTKIADLSDGVRQQSELLRTLAEHVKKQNEILKNLTSRLKTD